MSEHGQWRDNGMEVRYVPPVTAHISPDASDETKAALGQAIKAAMDYVAQPAPEGRWRVAVVYGVLEPCLVLPHGPPIAVTHEVAEVVNELNRDIDRLEAEVAKFQKMAQDYAIINAQETDRAETLEAEVDLERGQKQVLMNEVRRLEELHEHHLAMLEKERAEVAALRVKAELADRAEAIVRAGHTVYALLDLFEDWATDYDASRKAHD